MSNLIKLTREQLQTPILNLDYDYVSYDFYDLGFRTVGELLKMRVFDMMNLCRISRDKAENLLFGLYMYFNNNPDVDHEIDYGFMDQYYDYSEWHAEHPKYDQVLIKDLVLSEDINGAAIEHLFNLVARAFFKSNEYNSRVYRFLNKNEYEKAVKRRKAGSYE